jgi:hypothetical protein
MKHLRKFNESLKEELQDFCETYLAYLIDDNFSVRISKFKGDDFHQILLQRNFMFIWSDVKDYFLPFLHFLFKDYELYWDNGAEAPMGIIYYFMGSIKQRPLTLEQINNLPDDTEISTLFIRVVKKEDKEVKKVWFRNF